MKDKLFYIPSYKGFTAKEKKWVKTIKGNENIVELFEHRILNKSETIEALKLLYTD